MPEIPEENPIFIPLCNIFFEIRMQKILRSFPVLPENQLLEYRQTLQISVVTDLITASFQPPPPPFLNFGSKRDREKTFYIQKSVMNCAFNCYSSFVHVVFDRSRIPNKKNS
jgi:hypothetical protein